MLSFHVRLTGSNQSLDRKFQRSRDAAASFNFLNGFQPLTLLGGFGDGAKTFGGLLLPQEMQTRKAFRLF